MNDLVFSSQDDALGGGRLYHVVFQCFVLCKCVVVAELVPYSA